MPMRGENVRFWVPVVLLSLLAAYSAWKLVFAHVASEVDAPNYKYQKELPGLRGGIYSCYGKAYPFVRSIPCWEYRLDPVALEAAKVLPGRSAPGKPPEPPRTKAAIVKTIAHALGMDYPHLSKMAANRANRYQFLKISADDRAYGVLTNSRLVAGIKIEPHQVREYYQGRHLSHVLGYVNATQDGCAGIELRYNKRLTGTPGSILGMKDARGNELFDKRIVSTDPKPGQDIFLTIDHNIQFEVEDALKWGVAEYGAGSGWCIVMDAKKASVLAMASLPDFDPIAHGQSHSNTWINRAVSFNYEPGSVMKVITAAAAFNSGFAGPGTVYRTNRDDSRYYKLPGDGSHVWDPTMTLGDAIVHSSNIVIGKLGYDLGPHCLWAYMRAFGFGEKTGIELPGEQKGILHYYKRWDKATWSRAAIGQGASVTAIQLIGAYQAIANDGVRLRPYIVDHITKDDGEVVYRHFPERLGRPITAATAKTLRKVMMDVASPAGTARRAAIRGYSIAGKTGTAQKQLLGARGYAPGLYRASFCGIVPAMEPRLVILVTLDFDQKTLYHQGGNSAGPIFRRIAMAALRYLMIPPDRPDELEEYEDDDEYERIMEERARKYANTP